jgi:hypothetical protein
MIRSTSALIMAVPLCCALSAQSLYNIGQEALETIPLTWSAGLVTTWDNNVTPVIGQGQPGFEDSAWSVTPYVQANFTNIDPQTTTNFYARVGMNYFLDDLEAINADQEVPNARLGFDWNHSATSRLRFSSRNLFSYEMEPEFALGIPNDRQAEPYFFYSSDNSVGYRWTERVGSYSGFGFTGFLANTAFTDRKSWYLYHQMRYQYNQRTVLTAQYRYARWSGDFQGNSTNHFVTAGVEHRVSQNSIFLGNAGVQFREVEGFDNSTAPFIEASFNTRLNSRLQARGFVRYSTEDFSTIQPLGDNIFQYNEQQVLRLGVSTDYRLTNRVTTFGGVDWINTAFDGGTQIGGTLTDSGSSTDLYNVFVGLRTQIIDGMTTDLTINYTDSVSDFEFNEYERIRVSVGLNYNF